MVCLNDKLKLMQPIRFLTGPEMVRIHQAAVRILERTGMTIDHIKALEYLRQARRFARRSVTSRRKARCYAGYIPADLRYSRLTARSSMGSLKCVSCSTKTQAS